MSALPALPGHPEPRVMRWTPLELACIEAYGRQCFDAGKQAGRAADNEAAFDQLLHNPRELAQQDADAFGIGYVVDGQRVAPHRVQMFVPAAKPQPQQQGQDRGIELALMGVPPGRCLHQFDCDFAGAHWSIWRCRHCGTERRR